MPMNQFLFDRQLAAMRADRSGPAGERKETFEAMAGRAKRIAEWRKANGLSNSGWPCDVHSDSHKDG